MEIIEQSTYFRCIKCGKDTTHLSTCQGVCGECLHLRTLGINTVHDYNRHLKERKLNENNNK